MYLTFLTLTVHSKEYLAERDQPNQVPYSMEELLEGRSNSASVLILFQTFIPCVIGRKKFKMKLGEQLKKDADICTVSDEAFALLLLENQYDRWTDIYQQRKQRTVEFTVRSEKRTRRWESDVSPKYTNGGIKYKDKSPTLYKGWKDDGIKRFNAICCKVAADRLNNPPVAIALKLWWERTNNVPRQKVNKNEDWATGPSPFHQLWDDCDDPAGKEGADENDGSEPRGAEHTSVSSLLPVAL